MSENKRTKEQWFDEFLSAYKGAIQRATLYIVKKQDVSEDIQQEIYCRVWAYAEKMMGMDKKALETYLKNIIRSAVADHFRDKNSRLILKSGETLNDKMAVCLDDPSDRVICREYFRNMKRLDQKSRDLLQMRIIYDIPFKDIGILLGMSEAAARKRYARLVAGIKDKEQRRRSF